jgi:ABC-type microcin C transport system permease subunit YejB
MAFYAESHLELLAFDSVHGLDDPVTLPALYLFSNVALVIKQHVFGQIVHFYPGR